MNNPESITLPVANAPRPGLDLDEIHSSSRQTVLVVEDEPDTVFLLKQILRMAGFNVLGASNGYEAVQKTIENKPDLVMLDLMMPEIDGWKTYEFVRQASDVPVIIVSAIHNKEEVVRALRMGIDDYVTKPFMNAEVVARVQAVLRRARPQKNSGRMVFPHSGLIIDFTSQEVILHEEHIQLTGKEFAIMASLAKHAPEVVQYRVIAEEVWGKDNSQVRNRIKYLIYLLRQKLIAASGGTDLIMNVDRLGYKLQVEEE